MKIEAKIPKDIEEIKKDAGQVYGSWLKSYFKIFGRRLIEWFVIYMFGYYNASFGWLVAPMFFLILRDKRAKEKRIKFDIIRSLANSNEREILTEIQRFSNLPSWVTFPDMERVEWLNKIICQLWPYAGQYVRDLCKDTIEPSILEALKEYKISVFKFDKIILGDTPPRFSGMKVYEDTSRHEIILDTDFIYAGDCKFEVGISKIKAGIKDLQISGRIRVVMKPLVRQIPLIGGIQVFFLNNPEVDFNLIGIADFFDMPGISDILRGIVIDQIANIMVLPNRYPIQLVQDINIVELKCPAPAGVLRLHVIEAKNLMKKDIGILGMGKSDPYCVLRLGAQKFQTKTVNNTTCPTWDYCCELIADENSGQEIEFVVFDHDDGLGKDELLGRANLDVHSIYTNGEVDMWVPLSEAKSGRIHVRATWLELSDIAESLDQQLAEVRALQNLTKNPLHCAVLMVWVDSASKLNPSHKSIPDPFVRLHVGNKKEETSIRLRTNDPIFEEGFTFLVRNPKTQEITIEVIDSKTNTHQGKCELDLNVFLKKKNLESVGENYSLSGAAGGMASIKLTITLRILKAGEKKVESSPIHVAKSEDKTDLEISKLSDGSRVPDASQKESSVPPTVITSPVEIPKVDTSSSVSVVGSEGTEHSSLPISTIATGSLIASTAPISENTPLIQDNSAIKEEDDKRSEQDEQHSLGRIQLTVKYGQRNNLIIVIHKVENLPLEEDGEIPDPYVKMYLLPDRSKDSKRKTDVIKDDANPIYDERFEYSVSSNELTNRTLQISVINKKGFFRMARSPIMGEVHLDCGILDPADVTRWYDLLPPVPADEEED